MGLLTKLRSFGDTEFTQPYECTLCGLTFKRRRLNCPACGNIGIQKRT